MADDRRAGGVRTRATYASGLGLGAIVLDVAQFVDADRALRVIGERELQLAEQVAGLGEREGLHHALELFHGDAGQELEAADAGSAHEFSESAFGATRF